MGLLFKVVGWTVFIIGSFSLIWKSFYFMSTKSTQENVFGLFLLAIGVTGIVFFIKDNFKSNKQSKK